MCFLYTRRDMGESFHPRCDQFSSSFWEKKNVIYEPHIRMKESRTHTIHTRNMSRTSELCPCRFESSPKGDCTTGAQCVAPIGRWAHTKSENTEQARARVRRFSFSSQSKRSAFTRARPWQFLTLTTWRRWKLTGSQSVPLWVIETCHQIHSACYPFRYWRSMTGILTQERSLAERREFWNFLPCKILTSTIFSNVHKETCNHGPVYL